MNGGEEGGLGLPTDDSGKPMIGALRLDPLPVAVFDIPAPRFAGPHVSRKFHHLQDANTPPKAVELLMRRGREKPWDRRFSHPFDIG